MQTETLEAGDTSGGGRRTSETAAGSRPVASPPSPESDLNKSFFDWRDTEKEDFKDIPVYYHGTNVHNLPYIMAEGFRPSLGAGADRVMHHYGVPVPGVCVSPSWRAAATYPLMGTTSKIKVDDVFHKKASQEDH